MDTLPLPGDELSFALGKDRTRTGWSDQKGPGKLESRSCFGSSSHRGVRLWNDLTFNGRIAQQNIVSPALFLGFHFQVSRNYLERLLSWTGRRYAKKTGPAGTVCGWTSKLFLLWSEIPWIKCPSPGKSQWMHTGICRNTKGGQVGSQLRWTEIQHCKDTFLLFDTILSWFMFSFFLHCSLHHSGFLPFVTGCYGPSKSSTTPFTWEKKKPGLWWSQFVFGVTAQGYRMLVTWHVFNEATAVVKKSLWHLCKSQWRGGSLLTTCSDELPIKDVASLAVGKSTTALMFRVLFMPYICSTVDACSLGFGWSLVDICHCSSCSSPNNGMTRGWWPSDQPNWGGQRGVHGGDPGGAQTSQARHELAWTAYSSRKQDIDL